MSQAVITSSNLKQLCIEVETSKSYANRALMLSALCPEKKKIQSLPDADDVNYFVLALEKLKLAETKGKSVYVNKSFPRDEYKTDKIVELDLGEGGTTIRFLLLLLATGSNNYRIKVSPRFKQRPYQELLVLLEKLGARVRLFDETDILCEIQGPINLEKIVVDCSKTTQVASAFKMLQSVSHFELKLENINSSKAYLEMTEKVIEQVTQNSCYHIPVDFSGASYFIALGLTCLPVRIQNLTYKDEYQADSCLLDLLDKLNLDYQLDSRGFYCQVQDIPAFEWDVSQCLDLAPTLAFLAANAKGKSKLIGIDNLSFKESDRVSQIISVLTFFNIEVVNDENCLIISGGRPIAESDEIRVAYDHRIVMMASLFMFNIGKGKVAPAEAVNKSFKSFFNLLNGIDTIT